MPKSTKAAGFFAGFKTETGKAALLALALAVLTAVIYGQTAEFSFISLDDMSHVFTNPLLQDGVTWQGLKTAFTDYRSNFSAPLTMASYMADIQAWGMDPGAMHRTNAFLFGLNAIVLFLALRYATGSTWKSFFAAALWAAHPLRVESIAWITERKDVLAGLFFMLALWSHAAFAKTGKLRWQVSTFLAMLLGVTAKPVAVVIPAALLLLDFWPLGRFYGEGDGIFLRRAGKLLLEKAHLFALSAVFAGLTVYGQTAQYSIESQRSLSNVLGASITYWRYLARTFLPGEMVLENAPKWAPDQIGLAALALTGLLAVSVAAWLLRKKSPEFSFGWFWFLVILTPNSGLISVGVQGYSDRYSYLPHVGLFIGLVWAAARLGKRYLPDPRLAALPGALLLALMTYASWNLTGYWQDTLTLFSHVDEVYEGKNALAKNSLASEYVIRNEPEKALAYYLEVRKLNPHYPYLKFNVAVALHRLGRGQEALRVLDTDLSTNERDKQRVNLLREEIIRSIGEGKRG
ncbi:tetratricopeptide repeat protein [bacterium]|nr:MAG: tetratricopeptide repeat protein [bacterium]